MAMSAWRSVGCRRVYLRRTADEEEGKEDVVVGLGDAELGEHAGDFGIRDVWT
jgi:hypothetical protein